MLSDVTAALACPVCADQLDLEDRVLRCPEGHSFDVAREGYVNLLAGGERASTADTPPMVAARREFLASGHFQPITQTIIDAMLDDLDSTTPGIIVDAAGGTGVHLQALLGAFPQRVGVVLDVSKHAAKLAARAHVRAAAVVTDVWGTLPLRDATSAIVMSIFGPRNAEEFARVLHAGGRLLVATPDQHHLQELVDPLGLLSVDPRKHERLMQKLTPLFELSCVRPVEYTAVLTRSQAACAALMGPSASHVNQDELKLRSARLSDSARVTVSVNVMTFALRGDMRAT